MIELITNVQLHDLRIEAEDRRRRQDATDARRRFIFNCSRQPDDLHKWSQSRKCGRYILHYFEKNDNNYAQPGAGQIASH